MERSEERILTTHVGSLPRTDRLFDLLDERGRGVRDDEAFEVAVEEAITTVVRRQTEAGIDVANDGEQPRPGFNVYVTERMNGFGDQAGPRPAWGDLEEFPGYADRAFPEMVSSAQTRPAAVEELKYGDGRLAREELEAFDRALSNADTEFEETFVTAASPGVIAASLGNEYYDSYEEFMFAVAREMRTEYELIADAGHVLQIDAPDFISDRHRRFDELSTKTFLDAARHHAEALNEATANIPSDQIRMHCCWGNYEGPHHKDLPLEEVLPVIYEADVGGLLIEHASPRHHHEWRAFEDHPLPDDWVLVPGVIDVKTNIIEHPRTVADRIGRLADVVGDPTRIIAGADCGFATLAGHRIVDPKIVWAKLEALADGAALASEELF